MSARNRIGRLAALIAGPVIAIGSIAGCGSGADSSAAVAVPDPIQANRDATMSCTGIGEDSMSHVQTAAELGQQLSTAVAEAGSLSLDINGGALDDSQVATPGSAVAAMSMVEDLSAGRPVNLRVDIPTPGAGSGHTIVIIVGASTYVTDPDDSGTSAKYVLVTADSSNPDIAAMAAEFGSLRSTGSPETFSDFTRAASSFAYLGRDPVENSCAHYRLRVDVAKLPASNPSDVQLLHDGVKSFGVDIWADNEHRPVLIRETAEIRGTSITTDLALRLDYGPAGIKAPPADEVVRSR